MKKYMKGLLLLAAGLMILTPIAMAQDALSVVLPSPWNSRLGTQLVYTYEDGVTTAARGEYVSYLTVTNANITTAVYIHVQVYKDNCDEVIDFVDILTPADTHVYNPKAFKRNIDGTAAGSATNGRFIMTITAISSSSPISDRRWIAYNWLSGQQWISHVAQSSTWMINAVSRMAVSFFGSPVDESVDIFGFAYAGPTVATHWSGVPTGPKVVDGTTAAGAVWWYGAGFTANGIYLWYPRPDYAIVNRFFPPRDLYQPVPSGDRLTYVSIRDDYSPPDNTARTLSYTNVLTSLLFDDAENVFSVPPVTVTCFVDYVVGFDAAGNFTNFIGAPASPVVFNTGGWIRSRPDLPTFVFSSSGNTVSRHPGMLWGIFEQSIGTYGGGDDVVGLGRRLTWGYLQDADDLFPGVGATSYAVKGRTAFPVTVGVDPITFLAINATKP